MDDIVSKCVICDKNVSHTTHDCLQSGQKICISSCPDQHVSTKIVGDNDESSNEMICSLMMSKDHPDYFLVCVYEELLSDSYIEVSKAMRSLGTSVYGKTLLRNKDFWTNLSNIMKQHLDIAMRLRVSGNTISEIRRRINLTERILIMYDTSLTTTTPKDGSPQ